MRCLLVEDSSRLQQYVAKGLRFYGFAVDTAGDGNQALQLLKTGEYDVIVLDLMLPVVDGYQVLDYIVNQAYPAQVLILSALDSVEERVRGLKSGADDYLVKPFSLSELVARVQALVRRKYRIKNPLLQVGSLILDMNKREAFDHEISLDLRPREYSVLEYLAVRREEVVSRREIEQHVYMDRMKPVSNSIESAISSLRKILKDAGSEASIETHRGVGYMLLGPG